MLSDQFFIITEPKTVYLKQKTKEKYGLDEHNVLVI